MENFNEVELISAFLEELKAEIVQNLKDRGNVASGETINSLEVIPIDENTVALWGAKHLMALEDGRKPTRSGAESGSPTLFERIKQWIDDKGLDLNPYAVTKKIHKEGTSLYRQGGKSGVISTVITEQRINNFLEIFSREFMSSAESAVISEFN